MGLGSGLGSGLESGSGLKDMRYMAPLSGSRGKNGTGSVYEMRG